MKTITIADFPPELLYAVCAQLYSAGLPASCPSLDPLVVDDHGVPTSLPSSVPAGNWPEPLTRRTLVALCLVNHAWYGAAKQWLWRRAEIRLPRSWLALVQEIAGKDSEDESFDRTALEVGHTIKAATDAALESSTFQRIISDKDAALDFEQSILASLSGPESAIPMELLSPPPSRDPSPRRLREKSKSPVRWKIMRCISNAIQHAINRSEPGVYVPVPNDPRPGRFVRHLDFNHFRTIGMRRSIDEGVNSRFVTGERVEAVLKEMPNLTAFGATEYMDGALTINVLKELFLRGALPRRRGRRSRGRGPTTVDCYDTEEDVERRQDSRALEAVDLTGCVSVVFVNALADFVTTHLMPTESDSGSEDEDRRQEDRRLDLSVALGESLKLTGLQRLGLRGVKSVLPHVLAPFVLAFPSLTHLDLSGTRVTPELLSALGKSSTVRLHSLALARCTRLTSESIKEFLVHSPVSSQIVELSLYGDTTFPSPLVEDDLREILSLAPSFTSGEMVYLDLSSAPLTKVLLSEVCKPQPKLRSLGVSYIQTLALKDVSDFIKNKASNVEILTLVGTSPELDCGLRMGVGALRPSPLQGSVALHTQIIRPLCTSLLSFSHSAQSSKKQAPPRTRLRVIELATPMLACLGGGAGSWRIIRSKGGRGWYVDTASGWVASYDARKGSETCEGSVLRRDLEVGHPLRVQLEKWANANGNVNSGVGWHARKMEILHGQGMLGREDGLYGAVSFAYQG